MSKLKKSINLLTHPSSKQTDFKEKFEIQERPVYANLTAQEETQFKNLLYNTFRKETDVEKDSIELVSITQEIRNIQKQEVLLHGERISRAQKILTNYSRGAFSYWLEMTYGNRRTPYNFFYYYSLYQILPSSEEKNLLQKMPPKIIYIMGGKKIKDEEKIKFIKNHHKKSLKELEEIISENFKKKDGKDPEKGYLKSSLNFLKKVSSKKSLSKESLKVIKEIRSLLKEFPE